MLLVLLACAADGASLVSFDPDPVIASDKEDKPDAFVVSTADETVYVYVAFGADGWAVSVDAALAPGQRAPIEVQRLDGDNLTVDVDLWRCGVAPVEDCLPGVTPDAVAHLDLRVE